MTTQGRRLLVTCLLVGWLCLFGLPLARYIPWGEAIVLTVLTWAGLFLWPVYSAFKPTDKPEKRSN